MVSIGTVWDRTVDFTRGHLGRVLPVVLATQFLPGVVTGSLEGVRAAASGGVAFALAMLTLATTLLAFWGGLYLTGYAAQDRDREDAGTALRIANTRFLPLLGVSLLLFVAVAVVLVPGIVIAFASGFDFTAVIAGTTPTPDQLQSLGWSILYFFVAALVLLWVFARLLPLGAVVAMERRGVGAIARAFELTRGMALKLVGLLILYSIVSGIAVAAATLVFGTIFALVSDPGQAFSVGIVVTAIAVAAISAALSLFQAVFVGKLYRAIVGEEDKAAVFE